MQSYVKNIKIVPELDLSKWQTQWKAFIKDIGSFSDDLRKPFDDIQNDFTINLDKNETFNKTKNVSNNVSNTETTTKTIETNVNTFEKVDRKENNDIVNTVQTFEEPVVIKPEPITKRKNQVVLEEKVRDKVDTKKEEKLDAKSLLKEIDKSLSNKSYLQEEISEGKVVINDFFKGLQKSLAFTPGVKNKIDTKEQIADLDKLINYLETSGDKIQNTISSLKEELTKTEGYELYEQNEANVSKVSANEKEIARLKLSGKEDSETVERISQLTEENIKLNEKISSFDVIKGDFKQMISLLSSIEELDERYNELWGEKEDAEDAKEDLEQNLKTGNNGDGEEEVDWEAIGKQVGEMITSALTGLLSSYINMWGDILKEALKEFDRMSQYSLDTSLRINSEARQQALQYGLSDAQNYALTRTKEEMGIQSEEDMMMMTPAQQERFAERIGYYSDQYSQISDKDLFSKYEEYQAAVQEFQNEFQMEVIEFFAENKDVIIAVMNFLMDVLSGIMDAITWIVDILGGDKKVTEKEKAARVSDTINSYSVANNSSTNVKIDNSFTNIPIQDQQQYAQAGQRVNEQLINALDGRLGG